MSVTVEGTIVALRVLGNENPDYVYPRVNDRCDYVRDGKPSCIAAKALFAQGVTIERLTVLDGDYSGVNVQQARAYGVDAPSEALDILRRAQSQQDSGKTWATAVEYALSGVK